MVKTHTFKNGLRLVVQEMQGLLSVTMGILVGAGGAYETDETDGISHYIEHMQFKGTPTRTAEEISSAFDDIGAQVNAFTGKEMTCYYTKSTSVRAKEAFALLADLFLNATFPEEESVREKGVICEEIAMNEDAPDDLVFDVLAHSMYGNESYGRNILGPAENVKGFTKADVDKYKSRFYVPENTVISFAGAISFEQAKEWTESFFSSMQGGTFKKQEKTIVRCSRSLFKNKPIEQVHLAIGFNGFTRSDPRTEAGKLVNVAMGSGMSSRLFLEVRERLGLAYSVYSYGTANAECGNFAIYAGVNPKNVEKAYEAICGVIAKMAKEGVSKAEFLRAREQLRANNIFAQESTSSQMLYFGKGLLLQNRIEGYEEGQKKLDLVTMDDFMQVLSETFASSILGTAVVGDVKKGLAF